MEGLKWWSRRFGNPLEWSSAAKSTLLLALTFLMHGEYTLWAQHLLQHPEYSHLINGPYLQGQLVTFHRVMLLSALLTLFFPVAYRLFGDSEIYELVAANYYGLSHTYFAYLIGTLTLPVGIVLAGGPVLGFIFMNRMAITIAFISSGLVVVVLSCLSAYGNLPYAPAVQQFMSPEGHIEPFWVTNFMLFSIPHLIVLFGLAYLVLRRWREREREVRIMSRIDPLTGLFNRRSVLAHLHREQERSVQQALPMAVVMLDLDHFKQINDTWGHEAGDYVLIAAAEVLQNAVRQNDRVGRYGGEEFLLVLPGADTDGARRLAERCRQQLEALEVLLKDGHRLRVSASMGLYCNENDKGAQPDEMLRRADKALYAAKAAGRNRVVVAEEPFA